MIHRRWVRKRVWARKKKREKQRLRGRERERERERETGRNSLSKRVREKWKNKKELGRMEDGERLINRKRL